VIQFSRQSGIALAAMGMALAASLAAPPAWSQEVGAAAAVRPSSLGTPPGGSARELDIGTRLVTNERIQTTESGSLQVMFLDKSTLTVGPNSDMVIDQFVYDPSQGSGEFAVRLAGGALRFVGGQISHRDGATITTPVATIGIRGGAALITHDRFCETIATQQGQSGEECTKVVCMGGVCSVNSLLDSRRLQLRISEAVQIGTAGSLEFNVTSVSLNDIVSGGDGNIATQQSNEVSGVAAQDAVGTSNLQLPEPPPPPAPN